MEGIGLLENPLLVGPAISVTVSPAAGAVPLDTKAFAFSCTLRSNVKGPAKGSIRLKLPDGWRSTPDSDPVFVQLRRRQQTVSFQITPGTDSGPKPTPSERWLSTEGKTYEEGYRMVGYPGLRPYPYLPARDL